MGEPRVRRCIAAGAFVSLLAAISGAHLPDPPVLAFIEIRAVGLAGTLIAVAIVRAAYRSSPVSSTR